MFYTKVIAPTESLDSSVSVSEVSLPTEYVSSGTIFNRSFSQSVYGDSSAAASAIQNVSDTLYEFSSHWNSDGTNSVPAQIAASAGLSPTVLDEEDYKIVRRAFNLAQETNGLFDPTIGALSSIWRDGEPSSDKISWALTYTGYEQVTLSDDDLSASIIHPGITIDLNSVVPGMALQNALKIYKGSNIDGALLTMDGAAVIYGNKGSAAEDIVPEIFSLGLRDPLQDDGSYYAVLTETEKVICTSDSSSNLLSPETGYPVETDLAAVTVLSSDGFLADAMSSILYMQGLESVKTHLNETDYEVIALTKDGEIYLSDSVKEYFSLTETDYNIVEN